MASKSNLKFTTSLLFIFLAVIIIFISVYLQAHSFSSEVIIGFISHIGIGLLVIGTIGIIFDTNHWTTYFKNRLAEIVTEKEYLQKYTLEQLLSLQTDVLKAYFRNDDIGGSDGFLKYYQTNIQSIISSPFRTDVEINMIVRYHDIPSNLYLSIYEELRWVCKSNNGVIQKSITWIPAENEFDTLTINSVKLEHESFPVSNNGRREIIILYANFLPEWKKPNDWGFEMTIEQYANLDNLAITINVNYVIPKYRFVAWKMAYISKDVSLTVSYPPELTITTETYCMGNIFFEIRNPGTGFYKWESKGWVLPNQGVSFQLE